jgi:hypothetical protein
LCSVGAVFVGAVLVRCLLVRHLQRMQAAYEFSRNLAEKTSVKGPLFGSLMNLTEKISANCAKTGFSGHFSGVSWG